MSEVVVGSFSKFQVVFVVYGRRFLAFGDIIISLQRSFVSYCVLFLRHP
jgi:hypothetical protein